MMGKQVFTVGHSNHSMERFFELLSLRNIDVVVDVRSHPFSKYAKHFDHDNLKRVVVEAGKKYLYLGRELGGIPKEQKFYDADGHVLYAKIAESADFTSAIERLLSGISRFKVALMCGEEDPTNCHRRNLIGHILKKKGITVKHIRGNGSIQDDKELELLSAPVDVKQLSLFSPAGDDKPTWRSGQPVLRKKEGED